MKYHTLHLCGFTRKLPIVKIGPKYSIASFSLIGDVNLVDVLAKELVERIKFFNFDFLLCPDIKILPLVYQMSRELGYKNYLVAQPRIMGYMTDPIKSDGKKPLVLNGPDVLSVKGKKIIIVNDVVATGKTVFEVENLMNKVQAHVVAIVTVLKQGTPEVEIKKPFFYLQTLPLFTMSS